MKTCYLVLVILFVASQPNFLTETVRATTQTQRPAPCSSTEAHDFDFWIGDWQILQKILQADGSWLDLPATTNVAPALSGCALVEHWKGKVKFSWEGMKEVEMLEGLSVRAFDPKSTKWSIYWMDTHNPKFGIFEGEFKNGRGEFFRNGTTSAGNPLISRIAFFNATKTTVEWELAVSTDEGKSWNKIWTMHMSRK